MAVNQQAVDIRLTINNSAPIIIFTDSNDETSGYIIEFQSDILTRKNRFIGDVIKDGLNKIKYNQLPSDWQTLTSGISTMSKSLLDTYYNNVDEKTNQYEKLYSRILKTTAEGSVNNEMKILSEPWVVRETGSHPETLSELPNGTIKCNDSVASYLDPASPLDSDKVMGQRLNVDENGVVYEPSENHEIDMRGISIDEQFFTAMGFPTGQFSLNVTYDNTDATVEENTKGELDDQYKYSYGVNVNIADKSLGGMVTRGRKYEKNRFKTDWDSNSDSTLYEHINGAGKGNVVKNEAYKDTSDDSKKKLILGFKEIGDVFQVLMYYIWFMWLFHLAFNKSGENQTKIKQKLASQLCMITTDHVVYTMCKDFELTCIYTGSTEGLTSGRINLYKYQKSDLIITPDQYNDKITNMANSYYGRMKTINRRIQMGLAKMRIDTKNTWMLPLLDNKDHVFFLGNSELRTLLSNRNPNIFRGSEKHKQILDLFKEEIDAISDLNAEIEQTIAYEIKQYTDKLVKDDNSDDEAEKTAKFNRNKGVYDEYCAEINKRQETPSDESRFISPVKLSFCKMYQGPNAIKPEMILLCPNTEIYKEIIERITTSEEGGSFIYHYSSSWNSTKHGDKFKPLDDSEIPELIAGFVASAGRTELYGGGDENPPKSPRIDFGQRSPNVRPNSPVWLFTDNSPQGDPAAATESGSGLGTYTDDGSRTPEGDYSERDNAAASNIGMVTPGSVTSASGISEETPDKSREYSELVETLREKFSKSDQSEELAKLFKSFNESLDDKYTSFKQHQQSQSQIFSPLGVTLLQSQGPNPENRLESLFETIASMEEELFIYYLYEEIAGYTTPDIESFMDKDNERLQGVLLDKLKEKSKLNDIEVTSAYTGTYIDERYWTLIKSLVEYKNILDSNEEEYIDWIQNDGGWWVNINNPFVGSFDTDEDNSYCELLLINDLYESLHDSLYKELAELYDPEYARTTVYYVTTLCYDFIIYNLTGRKGATAQPMAGATMAGPIEEDMDGGIGNISKKHNKTNTRNRKYNTYKKYLRLFSSKTPRSQIMKRCNSKKTRKYKKAKIRRTRKTKK